MSATNAELAVIAAARAQAHPARSQHRRACSALTTALVTTDTVDAARRALKTFTDPATAAEASAILSDVVSRLARVKAEDDE